MSTRDKPKYKTFAGFLKAYKQGQFTRSRLEFVYWSSSCAVTISLCGDPIVEDGEVVDYGPSTLLLRCDTSDMFVMDVAAALGGEGRMA